MINPGWYAYAVCKNNTRQLVFEYSSPVHRENVVGLEFWVVKNHGAINEAEITAIKAPLLKKEVICNEEQAI